jgi:hypothetical protein
MDILPDTSDFYCLPGRAGGLLPLGYFIGI